MKIYYQWINWSYSYSASKIAEENLWLKDRDIVWLETFGEIWNQIGDANVAVLPIENSYAGSIHQNLYNFIKFDYKIFWEVFFEVNHCLLSKETDIKNIKNVYSHPQALSQCYKFLREHDMKPIEYTDTAMSAKMVWESAQNWLWAIASAEAWMLYWLNTIKTDIQDQQWNTTRFFIVWNKDLQLTYANKSNKTTLLFEVKHIPWALYKSLGCFATNGVNLTKIESLPSYTDAFTYIFWIDIEWTTDNEKVKAAIEELKFYTKDISILWEY